MVNVVNRMVNVVGPWHFGGINSIDNVFTNTALPHLTPRGRI